MAEIAASCRELERLEVKHCCVTDNGIRAVGEHCKRLKHLSIGGTGVGQSALLEAARKLPDLRSLNLDGLGGVVNNRSLADITVSCRELEILDVANWHVRDEGIMAVAEHCRQLERLRVHTTQVGKAATLSIARNCARLQYLDLLSHTHPNYPLDDDAIGELARQMPQLRHLSIISYLLSDAGVSALALRCPLLRHVSIDGYKITDVGISALARNCPDLHHLDIANCFVTDASITLVGERCRQLESVVITTLSDCITAATLEVMAQNCRLRSVSMSCTDLGAVTHFANVGAAMLLAIAANGGRLEDLTIKGVTCPWDGCVAVMSRTCTRLRSLTVHNCDTLGRMWRPCCRGQRRHSWKPVRSVVASPMRRCSPWAGRARSCARSA
eukprot:jgi/Mesvir1/5465/Mv15519-RA.1